MIDETKMSPQRAREEFWRFEAKIQKSREFPVGDSEADKMYGEARSALTKLCEEYEIEEMDGKPWYQFL